MNLQRLFLTLFLGMALLPKVPAKTIRTAHGTWQLVWQEEFRGSRPGPAWSRIPRSRPDWGKYMTSDDRCYSMGRGKLTLWGRVNDFLPTDTAHYFTGGVFTRSRKLFSRGRLEIRLKMDNAKGAWPAVWLLPQFDPWPKGGEIDIMERLNGDDYDHQTVHSPFTLTNKEVKHKPRSTFTGPIRNGRYNIYGVELYQDSLCFFINDQYTGTYHRESKYGDDQYPFDRPMYLLIDMQLGGSWVGSVDPRDLPYAYQIDYVRFYRKQ